MRLPERVRSEALRADPEFAAWLIHQLGIADQVVKHLTDELRASFDPCREAVRAPSWMGAGAPAGEQGRMVGGERNAGAPAHACDR